MIVGAIACVVGPFLPYFHHGDGRTDAGVRLGSTDGEDATAIVGLLDVVGGIVVVVLATWMLAVVGSWRAGRRLDGDARRLVGRLSLATFAAAALCTGALLGDRASIASTIGWAGGTSGVGLWVTTAGVMALATGATVLAVVVNRMSR